VKPTIHLILTVWGAPFVEKWAGFSLPTLISARNLPLLGVSSHCVFHFFTDRASRELLEERTKFLDEWVERRIHLFEETSFEGTPMESSVIGRREAYAKNLLNITTVPWVIDSALAEGSNPIIIVLDTDFILSDGALSQAVGALRAGKKAVMIPVLRLSLEKSGWQAGELYRDGEGISYGELSGALMRAAHKVTRSLLINATDFSHYPTSLIWPAAESGWLVRSFFPHPLAFYASSKCRRFPSTIDYSFALRMYPQARDVTLPRLGEEILVCKLTAEAPSGTKLTIGRPLYPLFMTHFLLYHTNIAHRQLANQPLRISENELPDQVWREIEAKSQAYLDDCYERVKQAAAQFPASETAKRWVRSFFGPVEEFLCPERFNDQTKINPSFNVLPLMTENLTA
jgi:hypothetical protein